MNTALQLLAAQIEHTAIHARIRKQEKRTAQTPHHSEALEAFRPTVTREINSQRRLQISRIKEVINLLTVTITKNLSTQNILTKLKAGQTLMQSADLNPSLASSLQTDAQIGSKVIVQNHGFPHILFCENSLASNVRSRSFLDIIEAQPQLTAA